MSSNKQQEYTAIITYSACSEMGRVRSNNEDNLYCGGVILTPETRETPFALSGEAAAPCLFAVCDGMGGQEEGEFASFAAASLLPELEEALKTAPPEKTGRLVQEYVTKANKLICDRMSEKSVRIGTTLVLVIVTEEVILPYNIGDSRIYEYTGGKLSQISRDHTLTMQKVRMGVLTEEEAKSDRDRNKLTRYLGVFEDEMVMEAEALPALPLTERRRLLLCSDGLTDLVNNDRIEEILQSAATCEAAGLLVAEALEAGGKDNVTCIVIETPPCAALTGKQDNPDNIVSRLLSGISGRFGKKQDGGASGDERHKTIRSLVGRVAGRFPHR